MRGRPARCQRYALALVLCCAGACLAGEPPALVNPADLPKPWRPIPELPEVLMYDDFESPNPIYERATVVNIAEKKLLAGAPDEHCLELGQADWGKNDKWVWTEIKVEKTQLKFPAGPHPTQSLNPAGITWQFNLYAEEQGQLEVKIKYKSPDGEGEFDDKTSMTRVKQWAPYTFKFGELKNKSIRPDTKQTVFILEIKYRPRNNARYARAFVDDVIVTSNNVAPGAVLPRIASARKLTYETQRNPLKDGFYFALPLLDPLRAALKTARHKKPRNVVVFGPRAGDAAELCKHLASAAPKAKAIGFNFAAASLPDSSPVFGLDDMRSALQYNLAKNDAEVALLMLGAADVAKGGDGVRTILLRTLESGTLPVLCLVPSPGVDKSKTTKEATDAIKDNKVESYNTVIVNVCQQSNLPYIDANGLAKGDAKFYDKGELNAAGLELLASAAAPALKHFDTYVFSRK